MLVVYKTTPSEALQYTQNYYLARKDEINVVYHTGRNFDTFHGALENIPEADYFQEKLDSRLGRIFKEKLVPFADRYPWLKRQVY